MAGSWRWVADGIGVTTSRRELTTCTVIVGDGGALLVDPGWDPDELSWIAADLARRGIAVAAGLATHAHHDHLLWHPDLPDVPRYASPPTAALAAARRSALLDELGPDWPAPLATLVGRVTAVDGAVVPWTGRDVRLVVHDAHAPGHTAVWVPAAGVLVAGDMLSDVELPLLEGSTVNDYRAGLDLLCPCVQAAQVLVPGHGHVTTEPGEAARRWSADAAYLDALIDGGGDADPRTRNPGMAEAHAANLRAVAPR